MTKALRTDSNIFLLLLFLFLAHAKFSDNVSTV